MTAHDGNPRVIGQSPLYAARRHTSFSGGAPGAPAVLLANRSRQALHIMEAAMRNWCVSLLVAVTAVLAGPGSASAGLKGATPQHPIAPTPRDPPLFPAH